VTTPIVQQNQPDGVPPLELTGERTLPDVPEENYWYQRHLVVYQWIARRTAGLRVVDLACGEGYGSDVLAAAGARAAIERHIHHTRDRLMARGSEAAAAAAAAAANGAA